MEGGQGLGMEAGPENLMGSKPIFRFRSHSRCPRPCPGPGPGSVQCERAINEQQLS